MNIICSQRLENARNKEYANLFMEVQGVRGPSLHFSPKVLQGQKIMLQAPSYKTRPDGALLLASHGQRRSTARAWTHKIRASTLVVGVITNEFHKVLVNICVQVDFAWRKHTLRARDTSAIQCEILSANQARVRGSMGPPELANRLKKGPLTRNRHGDPPSSLQVKFEVGWLPFLVDRPTWSADHRSVHLIVVFHVSHPHSMPRSILGGSELNSGQKNPWHPSINSSGGGSNGDTQHIPYSLSS